MPSDFKAASEPEKKQAQEAEFNIRITPKKNRSVDGAVFVELAQNIKDDSWAEITVLEVETEKGNNLLDHLIKTHNDNLDLEIKITIAAELGMAIDDVTQDVVDKWFKDNEEKDEVLLREVFKGKAPKVVPPEEQIAADIKIIKDIVNRRKAAKKR